MVQSALNEPFLYEGGEDVRVLNEQEAISSESI